MQGVLFALVPIFAWGAVGLVANKFGGDPNQQTLGMTLGAFVFCTYCFLIPHANVDMANFLNWIYWWIALGNWTIWSV